MKPSCIENKLFNIHRDLYGLTDAANLRASPRRSSDPFSLFQLGLNLNQTGCDSGSNDLRIHDVVTRGGDVTRVVTLQSKVKSRTFSSNIMALSPAIGLCAQRITMRCDEYRPTSNISS